MELDLLGQRADRHRRDDPGRASASTRATARAAASTCPAWRSSSSGLLALVWGVINGNEHGWTDPTIVAALGRRRRPAAPASSSGRRAPASRCSRSRFFRSRAFSAANGVSFLMYFGVFGSIFLLSQFFQVVQGLGPFEAGLRTLPWTAMPAIVAPDRRVCWPVASAVGPLLVAGMVAAGRRPRLARRRRRAPTVEYAVARPGLHPGRRRHGPVLRADRGHRPVVGARGRGGQGLRAPRTPSARSAACSGWPCWPACSAPTARMLSPTAYVAGLQPADLRSVLRSSPSAAVVALALPGRVRRRTRRESRRSLAERDRRMRRRHGFRDERRAARPVA